MMIFLVHINYLAVLLCAVASLIWGYLWYGPLFGKEWSKMVGLTPEKMAKAQGDMSKNYGLMFLMSLLMAYVLAHLVWYAAPGSLTLLISVKTAVWAWLGFIFTTFYSRTLFTPDKKPLKLFYIESGFYLVSLVTMGVIFAIFK